MVSAAQQCSWEVTIMSIHFSRLASVICLTGATALLGACADAPPRPVAELAQARTLVQQAEQGGAQQFAGAELERAREQIKLAEAAEQKENMEGARRLAVQAALDARLANVKTQQAKAEQAATELDASVETLRQESQRSAPQTEQQ
jgi:hypothetical protein